MTWFDVDGLVPPKIPMLFNSYTVTTLTATIEWSLHPLCKRIAGKTTDAQQRRFFCSVLDIFIIHFTHASTRSRSRCAVRE